MAKWKRYLREEISEIETIASKLIVDIKDPKYKLLGVHDDLEIVKGCCREMRRILNNDVPRNITVDQ